MVVLADGGEVGGAGSLTVVDGRVGVGTAGSLTDIKGALGSGEQSCLSETQNE